MSADTEYRQEEKTVNEKIFKTMTGTGAMALVTGIVVLTTGIVTGILMIVSGARLLRDKSGITF